MHEDNIQKLKREVLGKIHAGEVKMKPKTFFVLKVLALVVITTVIFAFSTLLLSYIIYSLKAGGYIYLLGYGTEGFLHFFMIFPWLILLVDMILLIILDSLLKSFKFGYHSPIIYLFLGSLLVITATGSAINFTSFHSMLMHRAEEKRLPFMGGLYQAIRRSDGKEGIFQGEVVAIQGNTFDLMPHSLDKDNAKVIRVEFPSNVSTSSFLRVGDEVFVAGDVSDNEIKAYGIGKLPLNF